jgi:hypothetical protein
MRGDVEAAAAEIRRAVTMFREMGITTDLDDTERELAAR